MIIKSTMSVVTSTFQFLCLISLLIVRSRSVVNFGQCITPNSERALCIHLEECTFLYKLLTKKPMLESDRVFLQRSQCGSNNGKILICCPQRQISIQLMPTPPVRKEIKLQANLPEPATCYGNLITNRIYGGKVAEIDEYPFTVMIEYDKGENRYGFQCGGSLISDRYVLTAAHCISDIPPTWKPYRVRLGEWDLTTNPDCVKDASGMERCADPHIDVTIEKVIPHEKYQNSIKNQPHDIALIRLSRRVTFTNFIRPICLPTKETLKASDLVGRVMDVAGWGKTENGTSSNVKLKSEVSVVSLSDCQKIYRKLNFEIHNSQMCAGGEEGIDTCRGDSGGPLIGFDSTNERGIYYFIAGIVSFGATPCGLKDWPGVYTRISDYLDWIERNIEP